MTPTAPLDRPSELSSLADRMGFMIAVRFALAAVVVAWSALGPKIGAASLDQVAGVSAVYVLLSVATEWIRRRSGQRALWAVSVLLLLDGVYLAAAMYVTGGTQSPLRFLTYLHVVAVTLLASFKTGLKIALWHTLLTFVLLYAQAANLVEPVDVVAKSLRDGHVDFPTQSVLNVTAFWLFALGTALLSALNERELRRARRDLGSLVEFGSKLEDAPDPSDQAGLLLESLSEVFRFERGVVLRAINGRLSVLGHRGPGERAFEAAPVDPVVRQARRARRPLLLGELDLRRAPALAALLPLARNVMVCPMVAEGRFLGAVVLETGRHGMWIEQRVVSMVAQFCSVAALHLRTTTLLKQVQELADTDPLTGVANRRVFESALAREMMRSSRQGTPLALVLMDIDHFKAFNDSFGHPAGDTVLRTVADVMREVSRAPDLVARYGGEEFAVILPDCPTDQALGAAERIRKAVAEAPTIAPITASVGVATFPDAASSAEALIQAADGALYAAKQAGRDRALLHEPGGPRVSGNGSPERQLELASQVAAAIRGAAAGGGALSDVPGQMVTEIGSYLTMGLRHSEQRREQADRIQRVLSEGAFEVLLQPIVELRSGRASGFEALARFHGGPHEDSARWFAEARAAGLGVELEMAALRQALGRADDLPGDVFLSVNLSPETLVRHAAREVMGTMDAERLVVEITEHDPLEHYEALTAFLSEFRARGGRLAVDDVGAGFANFGHILKLSPDLIKLDVSLTRGIDADPSRRALARSLVSFGSEIGAPLIAEGIETEGELRVLRRFGVTFGQGYLLGRPAESPSGA